MIRKEITSKYYSITVKRAVEKEFMDLCRGVAREDPNAPSVGSGRSFEDVMLKLKLRMKKVIVGLPLSQPLQYIELHRDSAGASESQMGIGRLCASQRKNN